MSFQWRRIFSKLRALPRDKRGNVAIIFALTLVPLLVAAGVALDYSRALVVRNRLNAALDSAALAVGRSTGLSQAEMEALAQNYFDANYPSSELGTPVPVTVSVDGNLVTVSTDASVATSLMKIAGFQTIDVHAQSQVTKETQGLDLALVLDTTGSMGSNNKLQTMKDAATDLVNTLFGDSDYPDLLKIGIVPFTISVRVDTAKFDTSWMDTAGENPYAKLNFSDDKYAWWLYTDPDGLKDTPWQGCMEMRPNRLDETDDPPESAETRFVPYFQPDEPESGTGDPGVSTSYSSNYIPVKKIAVINAATGIFRTASFTADNFTFGSINSSNDRLTLTGHGFSTGYGPIYISSTGSMPGGLSASTGYYVIKVDNNTIKLATSSSNASNGTAVNITSSGSGTITTPKININNDTITVAGHDLQTGDGIVRIAASTLPSPLSATTNYYVIRVDNNTIKLATSAANASSGTAVNLTSSGAGTVTGSGIDVAGNTIRVPGHGFSTGDGPIAISSTGTIPGGVSGTVNYYAIKIDNDTFKLSTTPNGSAVDITSIGQGMIWSGFNPSTDTAKIIGHGLKTNDGPLTVSAPTLPDGLSSNSSYYVNAVDGDDIKLTNSGGSTRNITSFGAGLMTLISGSVDPDTDKITKSGHGASSGMGPVRVSTSGTLPGGLDAATDYWYVKINNNEVKLATSYANATATTPVTVDITSPGSGSITFEEVAGGGSVEDQKLRRNYWKKYVGRTFSAGAGPNAGCDMQPITPLTNNKALLLSKIQALNAAGNTHIPVGLSWGWKVLSSDPPFTEGVAYSNPHYIKAIVLMTDGDNTMGSQNSSLNGSQYTSYGYAKQERMGSGINSAGGMESGMDSALTRTCNNIKAIKDSENNERIKIFTIGVQISNSNTLALLEDCASEPKSADEQYYFNATDNASLTDAFHEIATQLSNLRVSR